jgi:hypothetical protein
MKETTKEWAKALIKLYTILYTFTYTTLILLPMFLLAYFSGTYKCTMEINLMGEANIEMVEWIIVTPILVYGSYLIAIDILDILDERLKKLKGDN